MDNIVLPDDLEINYQNNHYKSARDVFDSKILCAICNCDLKQSIVIEGNIILHKTYLCLCCKCCFEQLSNSQNGCTFCSLDTKLKTCEKCNTKMCKRCIDNYNIESVHSKYINGCIKCITSVLWNIRSQAAAVLKCFSLELDTRILLNGNKSEYMQNAQKFIINNAKYNENFTREDFYQIQVKCVRKFFVSKIKSLFDEYQQLEAKHVEQHLCNFNELCQHILSNTCSVLLKFKPLLNQTNIDLLNKNINLVSRNCNFSSSTESSCNNILKGSYSERNVKGHHDSFKSPTCCTVSLVKLDEKIIKQYSLNKLYNTTDQNSKSKIHNSNEMFNKREKSCWNPVIRVERFDYKKNDIGRKNHKRLNNRVVNQNTTKCNKKSADETFNLSKNLDWNPTVKVERLAEKNLKNCTAQKSKKNCALKNCSVVLEMLDVDTKKHIYQNRKLYNTTDQNSKSKIHNSNEIFNKREKSCWNPVIRVERFDYKKNDIGRKNHKRLNNRVVNQNTTKCNKKSADETFNLSKNLDWNPTVKVERLAEKNLKNCTAQKSKENCALKDCSVVLEMLDVDTKKHIYQNRKENTEANAKTKTIQIKKRKFQRKSIKK